MWDENIVYPGSETISDFTPDKNKKLVKKFNTGNFKRRSAILKIK